MSWTRHSGFSARKSIYRWSATLHFELSRQLCNVPVICHLLLQVQHALRPGCADHGLTVGAPDRRAMFEKIARLVREQRAQLCQPLLRVATGDVYGAHTPALRSAKRAVFEAEIEYHQVAGRRLQCQRRDLAAGYAPGLRALANVLLETIGVRLAGAMAARDHAQRTRVARQRVEIERKLDVQDIPVGIGI